MIEKSGNNFGKILASSGFNPDDEQYNPEIVTNRTPNLSENPIDPEDQRRVTNALGGETTTILTPEQEQLKGRVEAKIAGLRAMAINASPAVRARIDALNFNVAPSELGSALANIESVEQQYAATEDDDDKSPEKPSLARRFVGAVANFFTGDRREHSHQSTGSPQAFDHLRAQLGTMTPDIEIYKKGQLVGKERTIG